jgi:hypothetical protein
MNTHFNRMSEKLLVLLTAMQSKVKPSSVRVVHVGFNGQLDACSRQMVRRVMVSDRLVCLSIASVV